MNKLYSENRCNVDCFSESPSCFISNISPELLSADVEREGGSEGEALQQQGDGPPVRVHHPDGGSHHTSVDLSLGSTNFTILFEGITNPKCPDAKDAVKSFNFDYSYWSHDVSRDFLIKFRAGRYIALCGLVLLSE